VLVLRAKLISLSQLFVSATKMDDCWQAVQLQTYDNVSSENSHQSKLKREVFCTTTSSMRMFLPYLSTAHPFNLTL